MKNSELTDAQILQEYLDGPKCTTCGDTCTEISINEYREMRLKKEKCKCLFCMAIDIMNANCGQPNQMIVSYNCYEAYKKSICK